MVSTRFTVRDLPDPPARVEKRGPAEPLAREAAALRLVAGRPWAPELVHHERGVVVCTRCPGGPRALAGLAAADAHRLGAVLREVHEVRRAGQGGLPWWSHPVRTLGDYRAGRARDAERSLAGSPHSGLARRALAAPLPAAGEDQAFRLLHGDLVGTNVIWGPDGPALVDWEFWRMGDPAEDLAYLAETNALPDAVLDEVLDGYALPDIADRVDAWRALVVLDAGGWYAREGMDAEARPLLERGRLLTSGIRPGRQAS